MANLFGDQTAYTISMKRKRLANHCLKRRLVGEPDRSRHRRHYWNWNFRYLQGTATAQHAGRHHFVVHLRRTSAACFWSLLGRVLFNDSGCWARIYVRICDRWVRLWHGSSAWDLVLEYAFGGPLWRRVERVFH